MKKLKLNLPKGMNNLYNDMYKISEEIKKATGSSNIILYLRTKIIKINKLFILL